MARPRLALALFLLALCAHVHVLPVWSHGDTGSTGAACLRNVGVKLQASFLPGVVTVDGLAADWSSVSGSSFQLNPALTDDSANAYPGGSMQIKVAHDGHDVFFLVQVPGAYMFDANEQNMAAMALMFPIGDDATYHNMGGCPEPAGVCNSTNCFGHEVDLIHFELNQAIPGRLYGGNLADSINGTGRDSIGKLNDAYAFNPHCRSYDGMTPSGLLTGGGLNNWRGSWTHSTTDTAYGLVATDSPFGALDGAGTYTFEFARPLRTSDVLQQDAQFTIGSTHGMAAAFWFPTGANSGWQPYQHYSASCDWLQLEIISGASSSIGTSRSWSALSTVSLLVSLMSLAVAVAVGWWVRQSTGSRVSFNPISSSL
ncbi:hypothetical protein M758_7G071800 [Ceratodon purpureus]|nr:hypothetical protein M758_7G071800 [Ceratodon purpureus]